MRYVQRVSIFLENQNLDILFIQKPEYSDVTKTCESSRYPHVAIDVISERQGRIKASFQHEKIYSHKHIRVIRS